MRGIHDKCVFTSLVLIFLLGMLVCSAYTSPLYPSYYGGDSALFALVGKGMTEGKVVYRDLFDHKGPILFFIETLGYLFGGRSGIFIFQCIFGVVNLGFLYGMWEAIQKNRQNRNMFGFLVVFVSVYAVFSFTFQAGNLSEEYSLPLISLCLLLFVKYAVNCKANSKHPYVYSFIYGVAVMLLVLIRLNNAITPLAGVFAIILYLLYKKEYKNILINLLFGFFGLMIVALPVCMYFAYNSALNEMLYATFVYNFMYANGTSHQSILGHLPKYLVLYMPIICSIMLLVYRIKKKNGGEFFDFLISVIVILNAVTLVIANIYPHYFTIYIPVFALVMAAYFEFNTKSIMTGVTVLCIASHLLNAGYVTARSIYACYILRSPIEKEKSIAEITKQIPDSERELVVGFNIPCDIYLSADITPCYKYYTHQIWWSKNDPNIMSSFVEYINSGTALWLLTLPDENNDQVMRVISEKYELIDNNMYINMYRLNENK